MKYKILLMLVSIFVGVVLFTRCGAVTDESGESEAVESVSEPIEITQSVSVSSSSRISSNDTATESEIPENLTPVSIEDFYFKAEGYWQSGISPPYDTQYVFFHRYRGKYYVKYIYTDKEYAEDYCEINKIETDDEGWYYFTLTLIPYGETDIEQPPFYGLKVHFGEENDGKLLAVPTASQNSEQKNLEYSYKGSVGWYASEPYLATWLSSEKYNVNIVPDEQLLEVENLMTDEVYRTPEFYTDSFGTDTYNYDDESLFHFVHGGNVYQFILATGEIIPVFDDYQTALGNSEVLPAKRILDYYIDEEQGKIVIVSVDWSQPINNPNTKRSYPTYIDICDDNFTLLIRHETPVFGQQTLHGAVGGAIVEFKDDKVFLYEQEYTIEPEGRELYFELEY